MGSIAGAAALVTLGVLVAKGLLFGAATGLGIGAAAGAGAGGAAGGTAGGASSASQMGMASVRVVLSLSPTSSSPLDHRRNEKRNAG